MLGKTILLVGHLMILPATAPADFGRDIWEACVGGPAEVTEETQWRLQRCIEFRFPGWTVLGGSANVNEGRLPMLDRVNAQRAAGVQCPDGWRGPVGEVAWSWDVQELANGQAAFQASTHQLTHVGPDGSRSWERCLAAGYGYCVENVAAGSSDEARIFAAWLQSEGHCKNIMDPAATVMGAQVVSGYWALVLADK